MGELMPIKYNIEKRIKAMKQKDILDCNKQYIADFIDYQAAEGNSKARQAKYCSILSKIGQHVKYDFKEAELKQIQELKKWINNSNKSNWTKHDYLLTIKVFYKYLYQTYFPRKQYPKLWHKGYPEIVESINPKKARGKKKLPRQLITFDDVKELSEHTHNPRDRALIITLYESGARISELLGLTISDIEFDKHGARITLPDATKTGARKIRVIWSAPSINHWLRHHPKQDKPNSHLFCGLQKHNLGKELQYRHVNDLLKESAEKAKINKPVNPHHFRHSRASDLAKKLTEAQLCEYMGWVIGSREARTYVHLSGRDTDKAILEIHGVIEEEKRKLQKTIECPRCHVVNDPFSKFCNGCGLGLDEKSIMEYDQEKEEASELGFLLKSKGSKDKLKELVKEILLDDDEALKEYLKKKK
jgi:integrase/recombinase XerD